MKFYSESLNKIFDSEDELLKAEREAEEKKAKAAEEKAKMEKTRKARAKEIEEARKMAMAARKKYDELVSKFCKDYGSYHFSLNSDDTDFDVFNLFWPF